MMRLKSLALGRSLFLSWITELTRPTESSSSQYQLLWQRDCSFRISANFRQIGCEPLLPAGGKRLTESDMQNRVWRIDQIHSREICTEVAERLRISLSKDQSATPTSLRKQLDQLRE